MIEQFIEKSFRGAGLAIIEQANAIIEEYQAQGFTLTLRQLYYQFVARALIENRQSEYKRLGSIISDARLAGLIDWDAIEDRTRFLRELTHWDSPQQIIRASAHGYREDKWAGQPWRVEVWIEKDALLGVIEGACNDLDVPYFACRGYSSQSELWRAGHRLRDYFSQGQSVLILHLGDHDPSGIDMTRDNAERLKLFSGAHPKIKRIALNMDQVEELNPPPNPAKLTDSRARDYIDTFGSECWELDALEPTMIDALIRSEVEAVKDPDAWDECVAKEEEQRARLVAVAEDFEA